MTWPWLEWQHAFFLFLRGTPTHTSWCPRKDWLQWWRHEGEARRSRGPCSCPFQPWGRTSESPLWSLQGWEPRIPISTPAGVQSSAQWRDESGTAPSALAWSHGYGPIVLRVKLLSNVSNNMKKWEGKNGHLGLPNPRPEQVDKKMTWVLWHMQNFSPGKKWTASNTGKEYLVVVPASGA